MAAVEALAGRRSAAGRIADRVRGAVSAELDRRSTRFNEQILPTFANRATPAQVWDALPPWAKATAVGAEAVLMGGALAGCVVAGGEATVDPSSVVGTPPPVDNSSLFPTTSASPDCVTALHQGAAAQPQIDACVQSGDIFDIHQIGPAGGVPVTDSTVAACVTDLHQGNIAAVKTCVEGGQLVPLASK